MADSIADQLANRHFGFINEQGEFEFHRANNSYFQQAYEAGVPISKNAQGEWYVTPYLEQTATGLVAHTPNWFRETPEYTTWINTYAPQIANMGITQENVDYMKDILQSLGDMGLARAAYKNRAKRSGITDTKLQQQYVDNLAAAYGEGSGSGDASLSLWGREPMSATELGRFYKGLTKEELDTAVKSMTEIIADDTGKFSEQDKLDALTTYDILNHINDNYTSYGLNKEFEGLLSSSNQQQIQAGLSSFNYTVASNVPLLRLAIRLGNAIGQATSAATTGGNVSEGWSKGWLLDNLKEAMVGSTVGSSLKGYEEALSAGAGIGTLVVVGVKLLETIAWKRGMNFMADKFLSSSSAALNQAGKLVSLINDKNSFSGLVAEFLLSDVPLDLTNWVARLAGGESLGDAWENTDEKQKLLWGAVGPEVPSGLKWDIITDVVIDLGGAAIGGVAGSFGHMLDDITGGAVTKVKNWAVLQNFKLQNKIESIPVIGNAIKKTVDYIVGPEDANFVRKAKQDSIDAGSIRPYLVAQNLLTLMNHGGAERVARLYQKILGDNDINEALTYFKKNWKEYGGTVTISTKSSLAEGGNLKVKEKYVESFLPKDVHYGVLAYERLGELKGQATVEGELIDNVKRAKEIAELQDIVDNLDPKIKEFAGKLSNANKEVEKMMVELGLSTQEWVDALNEDPRWLNYMTRQVLLPEGSRGAGSIDPTTNKLLTGARTGYYDANQTLDPLMALDMKVKAMGTAYAWNERAKMIVGYELTSGKVTAGTKGLDISTRISETRAKLAQSESVKVKTQYDKIASGVRTQMGKLKIAADDANAAFRNVEDIALGANLIDESTPKQTMVANKLRKPKGLLNGEEFAYPENVKTNAQKAKWLDGWRQKNPYLGAPAPVEPMVSETSPKYTRLSTKQQTKALSEIPEDLSINWFASADREARDEIAQIVREDPAIRNASINKFYDDYSFWKKEFGGTPEDFQKWLDSDVILYRYSSPQEDASSGVLSYSSRPGGLSERGEELSVIVVKPRETLGHPEAQAALAREYEVIVDQDVIKRSTPQEGTYVAAVMQDRLLDFPGSRRTNALKTLTTGEIEVWGEKTLKKGSQLFTTQGEATEVLGSATKHTIKTSDATWTDTAHSVYSPAERASSVVRKAKPFTEEQYLKANLWDNFFQKEISKLNPRSRSAMPDTLLRKTGDYIDAARKTQYDSISKAIKKVDGMDADLAMMMMAKNVDDVSTALHNYLVRQIDKNAHAIAKNMDGGATAENLNIARITLWSDPDIKASTIETLKSWAPDADVEGFVANLFDTQAKGLAAYDALPVNAKQLQADLEDLTNQLHKENKRIIAHGKAMDKGLASDEYGSFIEGGTHVIHYRQNGEDIYFTTTDPLVASMMRKPNNFKETGMVSESMQAIANFNATLYRLGTTGINPLSIVRNILRDPLQAIFTAGFNPLTATLDPEQFYHTLKQYGLSDDVIAKVGEEIREWSKTSALTAEMRVADPAWKQTYRNRAEKFAKDLQGVTDTKIIQALQVPLEKWEGYFRNQVGQQSFLKWYRRTGDIETAMGWALVDATNATTNFSHAVGQFKNVTSTIPYLSSAINGVRSFGVLFNADPLGMVTRLTAGFMVPVMGITMWNLSSEENRAIYERLPEWYKQGHLIFVLPWDNEVIALPLPEEIQQFSGTARKLMEYTQEVSPFSLGQIALQGALGFSPFEMDGFIDDNGEVNIGRGVAQLVDGIMPQVASTIYEWWAEEDLFTGQDLSGYSLINKLVNAGTNIFGTGFKQAVNSIGFLMGAKSSDIIGASFGETLARDLFGMGFNDARNQFMELVGTRGSVDANGKETKATGLWAENEKLQKQIKNLDTQIAVSADSEKAALEQQKQQLIDSYINRVTTMLDKYQRMFQVTGGLEPWMKNRIVQLLTLGDAWSSDTSDSYSGQAASEAYLNERGLAIQRYVDAGLPAGPEGDFQNSLALQAAVNKFYGTSKSATAAVTTALKNSGLKELRNQFYDAISQIYDIADAEGSKPDYDLIEKIQARYLQAVDAALIPVLNQYGINILNNNDFINEVRSYVNGMIPSDDWKQSTKNAKKYLSTKEFPTATVDVKKWLMQRYSSSMRDRGIASDNEVTTKIQEIVSDINSGRQGAAKGKIESLRNGINKAQYYISSQDYQYLTQLYNMVK